MTLLFKCLLYLFRFYEREVNLGCKILKRVRSDLKDVTMICKSEKKQTNDHRLIISDLNRGIIPKNWTLYKIPPNTTVIQWINDFSMRIKQLEEISKVRKFDKKMKYLNTVYITMETSMRIILFCLILYFLECNSIWRWRWVIEVSYCMAWRTF